jgi:hypothetical protein
MTKQSGTMLKNFQNKLETQYGHFEGSLPECDIVPQSYRTRQYRNSKKTKKCENTGINTVQLIHSSYSMVQLQHIPCTVESKNCCFFSESVDFEPILAVKMIVIILNFGYF